jgi:hypothetical protein
MEQSYRQGRLKMPSDIGKVTSVRLSAERLQRVLLSIPAAHCQTIFVSKDTGGWGVEARLLNEKTGEPLDFSRGARAVTVRACAPVGSHLNAKLELRSVRGEATGLWASLQEKLSTE